MVAQTALASMNVITPYLRQDSIKSMLIGDKLRTVFYVYAPESNTYSLKFWLMGVRTSGGAFSTYEVGIDGEFQGYVHPSRADWCLCTPYSMSDPYLTEGTHEIFLQDHYPDLPNAERVISNSLPLPPSPLYITDSCRYEYMKNHYESPSNSATEYNGVFSNYRQFNYNPSNGDTLTPPMGYTAELNKKVFYTFYRLEYYMAGETVSVNVNTQDNLQMVIHVLSQDGTSFSATSLPTLTTGGGLSCYIPYSGFYYVLVRSYNPDEWGTCNVSIQNGLYYRSFENVPVNCSRTNIDSPDTTKKYACFAMSDNGDPMVFLMGSGNGGGIVRYNDDFSSDQSNIEWKKDARIDGNLSTGQWLFTLTKSYPSSSLLPRCDIYTRCEKVDFPNSDTPYLELDDYLISSYPSNYYNSLSWAVGEWLIPYWFEEEADGNAYADSVLTAYNYVQTTADKSIIDLWAIQLPNNDLEYRHFSVKSKGQSYAGGYAWESKLDNWHRMFHPRYDLRGEVFGNVIRHYRRGNAINPDPNPEPIPDPGGPVLANINLTGEEVGQIEAGLYEVLQRASSGFDELYETCKKEGAVKVSLFIDTYEKMKAYKPLLEYCKNNRTLDYLLYQKVCERDILAIKLLKDLTLSGPKDYLWNAAVTNVKRICSEQKDAKCLHNAQSYGMYLIKLLLADAKSEPMKNENVTFSNSPLLKVRSNNNQLTISFELDTDATVSVYAGNTEGTVINTVANKQRLAMGEHTFNYQAPKAGSYVVGLVVNGSVYKKTIFIH
jgi:hypothetical protein